MALRIVLLSLLTLILSAHIELPSNEFALNHTLSSDIMDSSYAVSPANHFQSSSKRGDTLAPWEVLNYRLPVIVGHKASLHQPTNYQRVYDQYKPRDFYLII